MPARRAAELIGLIEGAGIEIWLDGGWAVDAVLAEETRSHEDLDIILRERDLPALCGVLGERGFVIRHGRAVRRLSGPDPATSGGSGPARGRCRNLFLVMEG